MTRPIPSPRRPWTLIFAGVVVTGIVLAVVGLWRVTAEQEQRQAAVTTPPVTGSSGQRDLPSDIPFIPAERHIVVPDDVRAAWGAVRLIVQDRQRQSSQEYVVKLGGALEIPGSGLTVKVGEFFPDLMISGPVFTSASNEPKNPAIHVTVSEQGREVFNGWLSALFPTIHPFKHERFAILLKYGVKS